MLSFSTQAVELKDLAGTFALNWETENKPAKSAITISTTGELVYRSLFRNHPVLCSGSAKMLKEYAYPILVLEINDCEAPGLDLHYYLVIPKVIRDINSIPTFALAEGGGFKLRSKEELEIELEDHDSWKYLILRRR